MELEFADYADPNGAATFDRLWLRVPAFHVSAKQYVEWGQRAAIPDEILPTDVFPPFDEFCIVIDPHADIAPWGTNQDVQGKPLLSQMAGMVVTRSGSEWFIYERTRIRRPESTLSQIRDTTTTLRWLQDKPMNQTGYVVKRKLANVVGDQDLEALAKSLDICQKRALRRVLTLCYLLDSRVWDEYDPREGLSRQERRASEREALKHGRDAKHYRIFLNRKRRKPNPDGVGTGEPKKWREHVRAHTRRYKSGRIVHVAAFDKGLDKPERPQPNEYDAWNLDNG